MGRSMMSKQQGWGGRRDSKQGSGWLSRALAVSPEPVSHATVSVLCPPLALQLHRPSDTHSLRRREKTHTVVGPVGRASGRTGSHRLYCGARGHGPSSPSTSVQF